jgi:hypothetical protein
VEANTTLADVLKANTTRTASTTPANQAHVDIEAQQGKENLLVHRPKTTALGGAAAAAAPTSGSVCGNYPTQIKVFTKGHRGMQAAAGAPPKAGRKGLALLRQGTNLANTGTAM